jgi:hypothetical protein
MHVRFDEVSMEPAFRQAIDDLLAGAMATSLAA